MHNLERTTFFGALLLAAGTVGAVACGHLEFEDALGPAEAGALDGALPSAEAGPDGQLLTDGQAAFDSASEDTSTDGATARDAADAAAQVDAGCVGPACPGTYVSASIGDDANPGTAEQPVRSITQGIALARSSVAHRVLVAGGRYPEKLFIVEGVDVLGGYACTAQPCSWTRDIAGNLTTVVNPDSEGVIVLHQVTRATVLDGLHIEGKGGTPTALAGSVALTLDGASPTIKRCRIVGGDTSGGVGRPRSIGVLALTGTINSDGALLEENEILGGAATDRSIGLLFEAKPGPASVPAVAHVRRNVIRGGSAPFSSGVVATASGAATMLQENRIFGGPAPAGAPAQSWGIQVTSALTIDRNVINGEVMGFAAPSCPNANTVFCGGILSQGATTIITNNLIFAPTAPRACAVLLTDAENGAQGSITLNANTLDGNGRSSAEGTISTAIALRTGTGSSLTLGSVRNNILLGGSNRTRYSVYEDGVAGRTVHLSVLHNNDLFTAPAQASSKSEFAYRLWNGSAGQNVTFAQLGTVTTPVPSNNLVVDPRLNAASHLEPSSPCIDKGTPTEAPDHDLDGDPRPLGAAVDIGADEAR